MRVNLLRTVSLVMAFGIRQSRVLRLAILVAVVALAVHSGGCARTTYRAHNDSTKVEESLNSRVVTYRVESAIYTTLPECAVVLPPDGKAPAAISRLAGPALARYLGGRITRIIGPSERRRLEKQHGLDIRDDADRHHFTRVTGCKTYLRWRVVAAEDTYFLVWSQRRIGLWAALHRVGDDKLLWQAAHTGRRSDGTLPLSALSVPFAAFEATSFKGDTDVLPSMIDDVVRRLIVTLPDLR